MSDFLKKLDDAELNLIIMKDEEMIFSSKNEGMNPLLEAINNIELSRLAGSIVVDKMIGKAAALLICLFKATEVHTHIMSLKAKEVLDNHVIKYFFEKTVPELLNKFGTDICPFEKAVQDLNDPEEGFKKLTSEVKRFAALKRSKTSSSVI